MSVCGGPSIARTPLHALVQVDLTNVLISASNTLQVLVEDVMSMSHRIPTPIATAEMRRTVYGNLVLITADEKSTMDACPYVMLRADDPITPADVGMCVRACVRVKDMPYSTGDAVAAAGTRQNRVTRSHHTRTRAHTQTPAHACTHARARADPRVGRGVRVPVSTPAAEDPLHKCSLGVASGRAAGPVPRFRWLKLHQNSVRGQLLGPVLQVTSVRHTAPGPTKRRGIVARSTDDGSCKGTRGRCGGCTTKVHGVGS